jgi:SAM-dependent methyltransferase
MTQLAATGSYALKSLEKPANERERLQAQSGLLAEEELALLRSAGLRTKARVLDLGCGGGETSRRLADVVGPEGQVVGVDRDAGLIPANGDSPQLVFQAGQAGSLTESLGAFDFIYARFLLQHTPDPLQVISNAAERLSPGGKFAVLDSDDALFLPDPPSHELTNILKAAQAKQGELGGDRNIGGKLPGLLNKAGLAVEQYRVRMITSLEVPFPVLFRLAVGFKAALVGKTTETDAIGRQLAGESQKGNCFMAVGVVMAVGRK